MLAILVYLQRSIPSKEAATSPHGLRGKCKYEQHKHAINAVAERKMTETLMRCLIAVPRFSRMVAMFILRSKTNIFHLFWLYRRSRHSAVQPGYPLWVRRRHCAAKADVRFTPESGHVRQPSPQSAPTACKRCGSAAAQAQFGCLVFITSSWPSSSSGTKPQPPHVGHCCSSSVPFSTTPSPLQSGQVFMLAPHGMLHTDAILFAGASLIRLWPKASNIVW